MSTRTQNYLEAVGHLPDDAVLILHGVTWEEYEQMLEDMRRRTRRLFLRDEPRGNHWQR
jgi:hypothetical protein